MGGHWGQGSFFLLISSSEKIVLAELDWSRCGLCPPVSPFSPTHAPAICEAVPTRPSPEWLSRSCCYFPDLNKVLSIRKSRYCITVMENGLTERFITHTSSALGPILIYFLLLKLRALWEKVREHILSPLKIRFDWVGWSLPLDDASLHPRRTGWFLGAAHFCRFPTFPLLILCLLSSLTAFLHGQWLRCRHS